MGSVILLLLAAQASAEPPLIPAFFTGERLHEICGRPNAGQCSMYVAGVIDGLFYARSRAGGPELCPARISNQDAADVVTAFLAERTDRHPRAAAFVVREALANRLECEAGAQGLTAHQSPLE